nr:MFS transporter [Candidatus Njordarchaeum guaymaensis]
MSETESDERPTALGFRNVVRLGYVSFFTDVSTEMILGVLPFFIVKELGGTAAILGFIEGVAEAVNYAFRVFAGVVTDKIGRRKPLVLLGYGLSSIAKPLFAVSASWSHAFAVRVTDRVGKGIRTSPRDALISDSATKSQAGKAFGLHRSLDQIGAIIGPLMAFVAIPIIGMRGVFWFSFIPAIIALLILLFFVRDAKGPVRQRSVFENARDVLNREFILLLVVLGIFAIGAYNFSFILLIAGSLGVQETQIPLVYASLNVATVILGLPAGILADKVGKVSVLGFSYILFLATSAGGLLLTGNPLYAFLIALLFGSYLGIAETVQRAIIPDFTKPELKGTAYALYYTLIGVGSLVANSTFGALWSNVSPTAAFQYSIFTTMAGVAALIVFTAKRSQSKP